MSQVRTESIPRGPAGRVKVCDRPEPAPAPPAGFRDRVVWLSALVWAFCTENVNWIVSALFHAALALCIAGIAVHYERGSEFGIESALSDAGDDEGFDNVLDASVSMAASGDAPENLTAQQMLPDRAGDALSGMDANAAKMGLGGTGEGEGGGGKAPGLGIGFFGAKGEGKSFVFIVDASGSMGGLRFNRAVAELRRSINNLKPEQRFYVFFFNDQTYPMFEPKPPSEPIAATPQNKTRAIRWINKQHPGSTTNPNYALQQALQMRPDVIFLLTDGELDEPTSVRRMILNFNKTNVVIHTIAFESEDGAETLEGIASDNNGTFRFVR